MPHGGAFCTVRIGSNGQWERARDSTCGVHVRPCLPSCASPSALATFSFSKFRRWQPSLARLLSWSLQTWFLELGSLAGPRRRQAKRCRAYQLPRSRVYSLCGCFDMPTLRIRGACCFHPPAVARLWRSSPSPFGAVERRSKRKSLRQQLDLERGVYGSASIARAWQDLGALTLTAPVCERCTKRVF